MWMVSGERLWPNPPQYLETAADAIRLQQLGNLTFTILKQLVEKEAFEMVSCQTQCLGGKKREKGREKRVVVCWLLSIPATY